MKKKNQIFFRFFFSEHFSTRKWFPYLYFAFYAVSKNPIFLVLFEVLFKQNLEQNLGFVRGFVQTKRLYHALLDRKEQQIMYFTRKSGVFETVPTRKARFSLFWKKEKWVLNGRKIRKKQKKLKKWRKKHHFWTILNKLRSYTKF